MVDQYLKPDTKRPLVGRVPGTDTSPPVPGTPLEVPDIISGVAYQASVVSGDGVTAVNYGAVGITKHPAKPTWGPAPSWDLPQLAALLGGLQDNPSIK